MTTIYTALYSLVAGMIPTLQSEVKKSTEASILGIIVKQTQKSDDNDRIYESSEISFF